MIFFSSFTTTARGRAYKLFKPRCTSGVGQNFFTERVINPWNSLPLTVSFTSFRQKICNVDFSGFVTCHQLYYVCVVLGRISKLNNLFIQLDSYSFAMCHVEMFEQIQMGGWMDGWYIVTLHSAIIATVNLSAQGLLVCLSFIHGLKL